MKREAVVSLSVAAICLSLFLPKLSSAQKMQSVQHLQAISDPPAGEQEALQMVPGQATLVDRLDARRAQPGQQFRATLSNTVWLKNGSELPYGTVLVGTVGADHMQARGTSKLALRFTQAKLKDGKVIPIKATIVQVNPPDPGFDVAYDDQPTNNWNHEELQIDQLNALSGVELHSQIASNNSGIFLTNKKDDVRLPAGTELELAIASRHSSQ